MTNASRPYQLGRVFRRDTVQVCLNLHKLVWLPDQIISSAKEVLHELAEYLSRRYPTVYSVTRKHHRPSDFGWYGQGEIETITVHPLHVTYELDREDSMTLAGLL